MVQFPNGNNMLVDGGDRGKGDDVVAYLRSKNITNLTAVVATHSDADHIAGLIDVLQSYAVGQFIDNGMTHTSQTYQDLHSLIAQKAIPTKVIRVGESLGLDSTVTVDVLAPPQILINGSRSDRNANTIVILLDYNNTEILLTGDPEEETETFLVQNPIDIDILKVGHHGSMYASSDSFLATFKPEIGIISVGADNRYGHPHQETLNRLAGYNVVVYRTDLNGNIIATTDGISYSLITERATTSQAIVSISTSQSPTTTVPLTTQPPATPTPVSTPVPKAYNVVICQVIYDPPGQEPDEEMIKLCNQGSTKVDIGGWILTDGEGSYTIPTGTEIAGGGSWSVFGYTYNPTRYTRGLYLANTHDSVALLDKSGNSVDGYAW